MNHTSASFTASMPEYYERYLGPAQFDIFAADLAQRLPARPGGDVLELACGTGLVTRRLRARLDPEVRIVATDISAPMLAYARKISGNAENIEWREADACKLPFADGAFDVVLSTFGVMFTPDQQRAAAEMVRVCRTGGRIALANWTPEGFIGQLFKTVGAHVPPPAGMRSPAQWGTRGRLSELFEPHAASVRSAPREFVFRYRSPAHWLETFRNYYGPVLKAFAALEPPARVALEQALLGLVERCNRASDGTMVVPSEYLEVVITRH